MSQNTSSSRKREILMRVAKGRVGALDSVDRMQRSAGACVTSLTSLPRPVRYGAVAGAGVLGAGVVRKLLSMFRSATPPALPAVQGDGLFRYLVAQLSTLVLFPWLRQLLTGGAAEKAASRWNPADLLVRWLGSRK